jgi:hypothetical protein
VDQLVRRWVEERGIAHDSRFVGMASVGSAARRPAPKSPCHPVSSRHFVAAARSLSPFILLSKANAKQCVVHGME